MRRFYFQINGNGSSLPEPRMVFKTLHTSDNSDGGLHYAHKNSVGPIYSSSGVIVSYARQRGDIPGCMPSPKTPSLLDDPAWVKLRVSPGRYSAIMRDYTAGTLPGHHYNFSKALDYALSLGLYARLENDPDTGEPFYPAKV